MNKKFYTFLSFCLLALASLNGNIVIAYTTPGVVNAISDKKPVLTVGSNRATGDMLVYIVAEKAGEATISLINESGNTVLTQTNRLSKSKNAIALKDIKALAEGTYTIQLVLHNQTFVTSVMIWK